MSKENKVNPGQYTQAGRLTPDETAREMKKQRETLSPKHTDGKSRDFENTKPRETPQDKETDGEEDSIIEPSRPSGRDAAAKRS